MTDDPQPFILHKAAGDETSPVVFDNPHSGIILPDHFRYACTAHDLMELHDPHIEKLLTYVPTTGSPVLEAQIHRTCIDLNRNELEIDPSTIDGEWKHDVNITSYVKRGFGLFPMMAGPRTSRISPIYNEAARLTAAEAQRRINMYYLPYYKALYDLIEKAHDDNGLSLYIDMHSMGRQSRNGHADIILGDLHGKTCHPDMADFVQAFFEREGHTVDRNGEFFKGGALIEKTADPANRRYSLQIEIARDLYMNQATLDYDNEKGSVLRDTLTRFATELRHFVVDQAKALKP